MNNKPVLFIDSGIGGIPYCRDFLGKNPHETVYYLADTKNFPYGPKEKDELTLILIKLTEKLLIKTDPKIIVLACNTATIAALNSLRQEFPHIPFVGTVPAVKPAAQASKNGRIGVLGTERTINEIHSLNLAEEKCEITGICAPELVELIELHSDSLNAEEKIKTAKKYIDLFRSKNADTIVLGCTHFLVLLDEFRHAAAPDINIYDSLDGITKRIEYLLDENNSFLRASCNRCTATKVSRAGKNSPSYKLLLTGLPDSLWEKRAKKLKFKLVRLNEQ